MSKQEWGSVSYLDALRPEPGWYTDFAVIASYSADLVAFVATLLALAGLDDDRGSGSKVDFANAIEQLRDRVRLVVQSGRILHPRIAPKILAILDHYIHEVRMDENTASWHPKVTLVKLHSATGSDVQWRLWIGSRNLTQDLSWDTGLILVGRPDGQEPHIAGIDQVGEELVRRAGLPGVTPSRIRSELRKARWEMPKGAIVEEVRLLEGMRALPRPPDKIGRLIVVSPFLDGGVAAAFASWGDAKSHRVLVSSQWEISKLAAQAGHPLQGFHELLVLDPPLSDADEAVAPDAVEQSSEDKEPEQRGLHAKIVYAEYSAGRTLWLGSANATQRGWQGPNVEIMCRMSVNQMVGEGLQRFTEEIATTVKLETLPPYLGFLFVRARVARIEVRRSA